MKFVLNADYYGTHSMCRTKATLIYVRTKNTRAVQVLLGYSRLDSTIRYLGVELEDALRLSEQTDCNECLLRFWGSEKPVSHRVLEQKLIHIMLMCAFYLLTDQSLNLIYFIGK